MSRANNIAASLALLVFLLTKTTCAPAQAFGHGTVVITIANEDAVVMVADGMTTMEVPGGRPSYTQAATPKVTVCGSFVCGFAGVNPVPFFDYQFDKWIKQSNIKTDSVKDYAEQIEKRSRSEFARISEYADFWSSSYAADRSTFIRYGVAGFQGRTPTQCTFDLNVDKGSHSLTYGEIVCLPLTSSLPDTATSGSSLKSSPNFAYYVLSGSISLLRTSLNPGTEQAKEFERYRLLSDREAEANLPPLPPRIMELVSVGLAQTVEQEIHSAGKSGLIPYVGIVNRGKVPIVREMKNRGVPLQ